MDQQAVLLTEGEVARVLRVSGRTVRRWAAVGVIPAVQIGGVRRFRVRDIDALIDSSKCEAPAGDQGFAQTTSADHGDGGAMRDVGAHHDEL